MKFKGELKTEFDDFARAISDVLETDVIITDADMNVIGSAFQYFSLYQDIKIGSLIAEVFYDNRDVLLEHKREKESCRQCPEYHNCKMESFVGVPIRRDLRTVGVIALILPKDRGKALFKKIGSTVTFMHSMAELIASKITDSQYSRIIEAKNDELKGILDAHDAALAYTDFYGSILFVNEAFRKLFRITEPVLGTRIQELFPYKAFQETFQKADRKPRMVKATMEQSQFFGIINIKPLYEHRHGTSMLFTFRRYSEIQKESVQFTNGSYITFDFLEDICDTELIYRGRDYARENKNIILVNTDDGEINELLAKEAAPELPLGDGVVANLLNKVAAGVSAFAQGTAMLAVSEETRDISGGFILKDGRIEVNCTFDALVRAEREQTAGEVAKLLFPEA